MSKTSTSVLALAETLNTLATAFDKLLDAKAGDEAKLTEAHTTIDTLQQQLASSLDDDSTSASLNQLADSFKALADKALTAVPA